MSKESSNHTAQSSGALVDRLQAELKVALSQVSDATELSRLEEVRIEFLGKKGKFSEVLRGLGQLSAEERPLVGGEANKVKDLEIQSIIIILSSFLVAIIFAIVISGVLGRPVALLKQGADKVKNRDFSVNIKVKSRDEFGKLICYGIAGVFLFHLLINVGMIMGIMPVTGKPLLFMSYGGSSLVLSFIMIGIVQSVRIHRDV